MLSNRYVLKCPYPLKHRIQNHRVVYSLMRCEHPQCNVDADILFYCRFCRGSFCQNHRNSQDHNCPSVNQRTGTAPGAPQNSVTPAEAMRRFAHSVAQTAQQSQQSQQSQPAPKYFADEKSQKKFIEKRLTESGQLFTLGNEVLDILFGFALIVLVFGLFQYLAGSTGIWWWGFVVSIALVGTAFLPHELAHKFVAIRKGQYARYILWVRGLMFTLLTMVIGIGLIVPGFVAIVPMSRQMDKRDLGLVAFAGPFTNAIIGFVSLIFGFLTHFGAIALPPLLASPNIFILVAQFNGLIALFNCIPVWQLDGKKILNWNKVVYFALIAANLALVIPAFIINPSFLSGGS